MIWADQNWMYFYNMKSFRKVKVIKKSRISSLIFWWEKCSFSKKWNWSFDKNRFSWFFCLFNDSIMQQKLISIFELELNLNTQPETLILTDRLLLLILLFQNLDKDQVMTCNKLQWLAVWRFAWNPRSSTRDHWFRPYVYHRLISE